MKDEQDSGTDNMSLAISIIHIWALALQLPMRRRIGKRMLGFSSFMALVGTLFYGGMFAAWPVLWWAGIYLCAIIMHRIAVLIRDASGDEPHSYYVGYPWIGEIFFRRFQEAPVKGLGESTVMIVLALLLSPFGDATSFFFAGGAVCMFISTVMIELREVKRRDDMRDAIIEGEMFRPHRTKGRW